MQGLESLASSLQRVGSLSGELHRSGGEASKVPHNIELRAVGGLKPPSHNLKTYDNNLFALESEAGNAGGSQISKINGCLEKCSERPRVSIPPEMIAKDVDYFSKHSLYYKFLGMRVSLQFLENWAQRTWAPEGEMEIMLLANNYFMVTFNCMEDRSRVFEGGSTLQRNFRIGSQCGSAYRDFWWNVVGRMCFNAWEASWSILANPGEKGNDLRLHLC